MASPKIPWNRLWIRLWKLTFGYGFEISGTAKYLISDGANVTFDIGYLAYSEGDIDDFQDEDSPLVLL